MRALLIGLLAVLSGCSTYKPAAFKDVENEKLFNVSYETAWSRIVSYASSNGMNIKTIDKSSGLIAFERAGDSNFSNLHLNCGSGSTGLVVGAYAPVTLNMFVQKSSESQTKVKVNLFGHISFSGMYNTHVTHPCYSRGSFENEIFCAVEGKTCPTPLPTATPSPTPPKY